MYVPPVMHEHPPNKSYSRKLETFTPTKVRLLRSFDRDEENDAYYEIGETLSIELMPNGTVYLVDGMLVIDSDPIEHVDFEFV